MVVLRSGSDSSLSSSNSTPVKRRWRKESTVAYHEAWNRIYDKRPPMAFLDARFRITKTNPSAPTLHFGFTFTMDNIIHCAHNRDLLPAVFRDENPDPKKEGRRLSIATMLVKDYLERAQKVVLNLQSPLCPDGLVMFSLYSNHTRRRLRRPNTERLILDFIREELNLDPEQTAKWYWDIDHGLGYKCEHAEFNL